MKVEIRHREVKEITQGHIAGSNTMLSALDGFSLYSPNDFLIYCVFQGGGLRRLRT